MVFATSDIHGYSLYGFLDLLRKAGFGKGDFLFVLGDVIDRNGDGGIEMLRWMMLQENVQLIRGNHEDMLLGCAFLFDEITDEAISGLKGSELSEFSRWYFNGAAPTIRSLRKLRRQGREDMEELLEYIREAPVFERILLDSGEFILCHAGLGNFDENRYLEDYSGHDLMWHRPEKDERYFEDAYTVFGHTPTVHYGCPGRAFRTDTWIDIDTGAAGGGAPMLLRLDDMAEFYVE